MIIREKQEYYTKIIDIACILEAEENRLTKTERDFLVQCCIFRDLGGDLRNTRELSKFLVEKEILNRENYIYIYKSSLKKKNWATLGKYNFTIPSWLDSNNPVTLEIKYESNEDI